MDAFMFDRSVLNGLASGVVIAGALASLLVAWCCCVVSASKSEHDEDNAYIFDDAEEFPHWDVSDSECEKTDPAIQLY